MTWSPHVTVAAVIEQDQHYLLVRERSSGETVINQPAGHLEDGESILEAVVREVFEETARHFQPSGLIGIYRYRIESKQRTYLRFCFTGTVSERIPDQTLDPDIIDTHWLTLNDIREQKDKLRSPMVLQCIEDYLNKPLLPLEALHDFV